MILNSFGPVDCVCGLLDIPQNAFNNMLLAAYMAYDICVPSLIIG